MRRVVIGLILLMLMVSQRGEAQQSGQESGPLSNLRGVSIVIGDLSTDGRGLGFSRSQLESQVLVGLKRNIPRLTIERNAISTVNLNVLVLRDREVSGRDIGLTAYIFLSLERPVVIFSDDYKSSLGGFTLATVWRMGLLISGPSQSSREQVRDALDRTLTRFAADYYRQNP